MASPFLARRIRFNLPVPIRQAASRLRSIPVPLVLFQFAGWMTYLMWQISSSLLQVPIAGLFPLLPSMMLIALPVPILMSAAICMSMNNATEAIRRPFRFLTALSLAALIAQPVMMTIAVAKGFIALDLRQNFPWYNMFSGALISITINGIFGWLSLLYLRNEEDRARLTEQLGWKSRLSVQLVQSRLLAVRAKIDLKMVTAVLRLIRQRHQEDPAKSSVLLDDLVAYLRLAMNRNQSRNPDTASELLLLRSYLALRASETGSSIRITTQIASLSSCDVERSPPFFPVVKHLFDEMSEPLPQSIDVHVGLHQDSWLVKLECRDPGMANFDPDRVRDRLAEALKDNEVLISHHQEAGVHQYAVSIPFN